MSQILTHMQLDCPDLVWVSSLHHDSTHPLDEPIKVAARLIISEQHNRGGQFLLENSNCNDDGRGIYVSSDWQAMNHRGTGNPIGWCALGLGKPEAALKRIRECAFVNVFTTLTVPVALTTCCTRQTKFVGRSILPSRMPKAYYTSMATMIHSVFIIPSVPECTYKTQKKQKPKPPAPTIHETPGDHADTEGLEKPSKKVEMENTFDDCGDDISMIVDYASTSALSESSFFDVNDSDSESEGEHIFNEEFFTWAVTGSTTCPEEPIHNRPCSRQFSSMSAAYAAIGNYPQYQGQHDICELFGGDAGTTRVCIRRGLKSGPSFDLSIGIDLTSSDEVQHLWMYLEKHRPRVVIAGPPCTSFGPWSRINRYKAYDTWRKNRRIGELLAKLTAEICAYQLLHNRHFIVENPQGSDIWKLPAFVALLADKRVAQAILDQCMVGLVDPTGQPTLKPTLFIASCDELIRRLRIRCPRVHQHALLAGSIHGFKRCAFAQVWPRRLVELLAEGIIATLKQHSAYPARRIAPIDGDPYGGEAAAPTFCPGCRAHSRQDDIRHNRLEGICRFPQAAAQTWECGACKLNRPSTHQSHRFDESCQWTTAPVRQRGNRAPGLLRDPRIPAHMAPEIAKPDSTIVMPKAPNGYLWTPLTNLETITELDSCMQRDGWHALGSGAALVLTNGRSLRSPEPRLDGQLYQWRSSFGYFPENEHANGRWYQIETYVKWNNSNQVLFGYPIPILTQIYHKQAQPQVQPEKIIPEASSSSSSGRNAAGLPAQRLPVQRLLDQWDAEQADGEPPPVVPIPQPVEELGPAQIDIIPEWSNFDLGASLRALRSDNEAHQNRTLRRLHLRWWHASSARMESLLRAAGVSTDIIKRIKPMVETCSICRMWQRPGHRSMTSSRMSEKFGETVQCDLLFLEDHIVLHLIDEAIRWTTTALLADKQASTILSAITSNWIKIFGPMSVLVSDQEGGLASEESAVWAERWRINLILRAKGQHANIVERHHQILRDHLHKILAQSRSEKLQIRFEDILSEATFVKNAMLQVAGTTPYVALLGRFPQVLAEFEAQGQSALTDDQGGIVGASRHSVRLREIAVSAITQSQAEHRMKQAEKSQSRPTGQLLDLRSGELCDIYRQPQSKDLTGWRGPAELVDISTIDRGFVTVRWGGRTISVRMADIRRSALFIYLTDDGSAPLQRLREFMLNVFNAVLTLAWVFGSDGWRLSKTAMENPEVFRAILHVALNELNIVKCIGARVGRGVHTIHGLAAIEESTLFWWPASRPQLYRTLVYAGNQSLDLKQLFQQDDIGDTCWVQFLSTSTKEARRLRQLNPDVPLLAPDVDDHDSPMDPMIDDTSTRHADSPRPSPVPTDRSMIDNPFDVENDTWQRIHIPTATTTRSRSSRAPSSKHPSPVVSWEHPRRSVPSGSEDNLKKKSRTVPAGNSGASSSTQAPRTENNTSTTPLAPVAPQPPTIPSRPTHIPLLPFRDNGGSNVPVPGDDDDDDLDSQGTHDYADFVVESNDGSIIMTFFAEDGTPVVSKDLSELTKKEEKENQGMLDAAIRTELQAFSELVAFEMVLKGSTGNTMSSRWVHRWKMLLQDDGTKVRGVKSRLTVHGFKDSLADSLYTFASTASRWSQRIVTAQAAQHGWHILTADVGNAFLRSLTFPELARLTGEEVRRVAFVPPKGSEHFFSELPGFSAFDVNKHEFLMLRAIYGLKDAPRAWRITLHATLVELKGRSLKTDNSIYYWHDGKNQLVLIMSAHVDDLKIAGEDSYIAWFLEEMTARFGKLKVQWNNFEHCGLIYTQGLDFNIRVSQDHYTLSLKTVDMTAIDISKTQVLLEKAQHSDYLSLLGGISWLSQTRLDVAIYTQALQRAAQSPSVANLIRLNAVVKWVRRKKSSLFYARLQGTLKIAAISDAAFRREDLTGLAMRGAIICLCERHEQHPGGRVQIIDFYSRRQRRIVRSTFGAELNSLADAFETAKLLAFSMAELMDPNLTTVSLRLYSRSQDAFRSPLKPWWTANRSTTRLFHRTRRSQQRVLIMILLGLKEALRLGTITRLWWVDTADMVSDGLNKGLVSRKGLLDLAATGLWILKFPAVQHSECLPEAWTAFLIAHADVTLAGLDANAPF